MGYAAPSPNAVSFSDIQRCTGVYICDLVPHLTELEVRQVFGHYGDIVHFEFSREAGEEAAAIEYSTFEAAEEAQRTVNHAIVRGKTCRCILGSALEIICATMLAGHRLVIDKLDKQIENRGLFDVASLFGLVIDCKVELDESGQSKGFGVVHYATREEAAKATTFLQGMQIGESQVEIRTFERSDFAFFTGCLYATSGQHQQHRHQQQQQLHHQQQQEHMMADDFGEM